MPAVAFKQIETLTPKKSVFDLSEEYVTTCDMGQLIPTFVREVVPSDVFRLSMNAIVRLAPMIWPLYHEVNLKSFTFFVPNRHLLPAQRKAAELADIDHTWENFITGGEDGQDDTVLPVWIPSSGKNTVGTLWDYLGYPTGPTPDSASCPNALAKRAYNLIYNEYFRDQNTGDMPFVDLDDEEVKNACWEKEYFTSALPWQMRGTAPAIPLDSLGGLVALDTTLPPNQNVVYSGGAIPSQFITATPTGTAQYQMSQVDPSGSGYDNYWSDGGIGFGQRAAIAGAAVTLPGQNDALVRARLSLATPSGNVNLRNDTILTTFNQAFKDWITTSLGVELSGASGIDLEKFRTGFQLMKWMERNARCGARYVEQIQARFNENGGDARLQRPEFIGGTKTPIVISEVLQTSQSATPTGGQPNSALGTYAGHGITADDSEIGTYHVREHGWIITLICIRPIVSYACQGIEPQHLRRTRHDFLQPEYVNLSEQAVYNRELCITPDAEYNAEIFGYQGRYNEYRYGRNKITGLMRTDFSFTHLARIFDTNNPPLLNKDFLECRPDKRIFAVPSEPGCFVYYGTRCEAVRPLPIIPEPGLIDHH